MKIAHRFEKKVNKQGPLCKALKTRCWVWAGALRTDGYGMLRVGYKQVTTHRLSWQLYRGEIPHGLNVCHHCDNKQCVRIDHLFLGTAKDNYHDLMDKELHIRGIKHGMAVLTEEQVLEIRRLYRKRHRLYNGSALAKDFKVSHPTIMDIVHRRHWKHL